MKKEKKEITYTKDEIRTIFEAVIEELEILDDFLPRVNYKELLNQILDRFDYQNK